MCMPNSYTWTKVTISYMCMPNSYTWTKVTFIM